MVEKARALFEELRRHLVVEYDDGGRSAGATAGRRDRHALGAHDRRADARGRHGTLRDRDSLAQERIAIAGAGRAARPPRRAVAASAARRVRNRHGGTLTWEATMASTPLFSPVLASLGDIVPHEGLLTPHELEQIAVDMGERARHLGIVVRVDADQRRYELVYEDERMDAWALSWMSGQGTGFHDHYISGVGIAVAAGGVREDLMVYGSGDIEPHLCAGDSRQGGPGYIHRVRHEIGEPAMTIDVYSPRLDWVGQYRLGDEGVVRREVRPGRNELTDQLVAAGALEHVLERFDFVRKRESTKWIPALRIPALRAGQITEGGRFRGRNPSCPRTARPRVFGDGSRRGARTTT